MAFHAWLATPSERSLEVTMRLTGGDAPDLRIVDDEIIQGAVENALLAAERGKGVKPYPLPADLVLRLEADTDELTFDYADIGYRLVSVRLREALGLRESDVQYLPVDTTRCSTAVRTMDYRWLHLPYVADPFDHDRSDGEWEEVYQGPMSAWTPDAETMRHWRLQLPTPSRGPRIFWRSDFVPPAALFQATGVPWTLATAEIVRRVEQASISDLVFVDVSAATGASTT